MTADPIATDAGAPAEQSVLDRIRAVLADGGHYTSAQIAAAADLASSEIAAKSVYWLRGKGEVDVADPGPPKRYRAAAVQPSPAPKPTKAEWIVEIYGGEQFLAPWQGDPGRTCVQESAKRYSSKHAAECALREAQRRFPGRDYSAARVVDVSLEQEPPEQPHVAVEEPTPDPAPDLLIGHDMQLGADLRESVGYAETWIGDAIRYRIEAGDDDVLKALLRAADAVSDAKMAAGGWL